MSNAKANPNCPKALTAEQIAAAHAMPTGESYLVSCSAS